MVISHSKKVNGKFEDAESIAIDSKLRKCTPYISPKEDYLIFASVGNGLGLMISYNHENGKWIETKKLSNKINNKGQGNPYVTPDNQFLFLQLENT